MPPINQKCNVEQSGTVYEVKVQECGSSLNGDKPYTNDRLLTETLSGAFVVAMSVFDEDPAYHQSTSGLRLLYEPHEDGEEYVRTTIQERRVYAEGF